MDTANFIKERVGLFKDFSAGRIKELIDETPLLKQEYKKVGTGG